MFNFMRKSHKQAKYVINSHMFFNDMIERDVFGQKDDSKFDDLKYDFVVHRNAAVFQHKHYQSVMCPSVHTMFDSLGPNIKTSGFVADVMNHATVTAEKTGVPLASILEQPVVFHQDKFGYMEVIFKCIRIRPVGDDQYMMGDF